MIRAQNIQLQIGKKRILDEVSTELHAGQLLAICGPNGAGKSSLLRILSGETKATKGSVWIKDKILHDWDTQELAKIRAVLHQESYLTFPFTVRDVVGFGRFPYGGMPEDEQIIRQSLQKVGMVEMVDRKYTTLSGGEKQRVHLARVIAQLEEDSNTSKILMLDEPTSALDLPHQEETLRTASHYAKKRNYCTVVVLHDLNLAAAWADRILFIRNGKVHSQGSPDQVLTSETIESIYGLKTHILSHPDTKRPLITIDRSGCSIS